jgi:multidrug resistance efflux pump
LSSPKSTNFIPHQIYAPDNVFIGDVLLTSGNEVTAHQPVLRLDTIDLESELARYKCELDLTLISAEKQDDKYLNRFTICLQDDNGQPCPLNAMLKIHQGIAEARIILEDVEKVHVLAGTLDEATYHLSQAHTQDALATIQQDLGQIAKKTDEINKQRANNEAKISDLRRKIEITQHQIELRTVPSPGSGKVAIHVVPGIFVEKGDLLFEVV